jgi:hypothetical protein
MGAIVELLRRGIHLAAEIDTPRDRRLRGLGFLRCVGEEQCAQSMKGNPSVISPQFRQRVRVVICIGAIIALVPLAGCASTIERSPSAKTPRQLWAEDYSACMRDNGVEIYATGDSAGVTKVPNDVEPDVLDAASQACESKVGGMPKLTPED